MKRLFLLPLISLAAVSLLLGCGGGGGGGGSSPQPLTPAAKASFSPPPGAYTASPHVALYTTTSGAVIRYTTDGTTPSATNGATYAAPIPVESSSTLKAVVTKAGMANSEVSTAAYTINTPPGVGGPKIALGEGNAAKVSIAAESINSIALGMVGQGQLPAGRQALGRVTEDTVINAARIAAALPEEGTFPGFCGGNLVVDVTEAPDGFSVSTTFNGYDDCSSVVNGTLLIDFDPVVSSTDFTSTFSWIGFNITLDGEETMEYGGSMEIIYNGPYASVLDDMTFTQGAQTLALDGMLMLFDLSALPKVSCTVDGSASFNGNYLIFDTLETVVNDNVLNQYHPNDGRLQMISTGRLEVEYLTKDTVGLKVDLTDNGSWDYSTGSVNWTDVEGWATAQEL